MKKTATAKIQKVRQIITTDVVEAANELLASPDWILISTYKKYRGCFYYVLGRIAEQ